MCPYYSTTEPSGKETEKWRTENVTVMSEVGVTIVRGNLETNGTTNSTSTSLQVMAWPPPNLQVRVSGLKYDRGAWLSVFVVGQERWCE